MRKKVITSAVIILILSIILLLINHYKGHNSIAAPEITLVYAEIRLRIIRRQRVLTNLHALLMKERTEELRLL